VTPIDRVRLLQLMESEAAQVVDVLPAGEYQESHLPAAINIPLRELTPVRTSVLSTVKPVVVYCHDGL